MRLRSKYSNLNQPQSRILSLDRRVARRRGASSKEAARWLDVSPRTIEFHRANIMQKLDAKNAADLVRIVVGNINRPEGNH